MCKIASILYITITKHDEAHSEAIFLLYCTILKIDGHSLPVRAIYWCLARTISGWINGNRTIVFLPVIWSDVKEHDIKSRLLILIGCMQSDVVHTFLCALQLIAIGNGK